MLLATCQLYVHDISFASVYSASRGAIPEYMVIYQGKDPRDSSNCLSTRPHLEDPKEVSSSPIGRDKQNIVPQTTSIGYPSNVKESITRRSDDTRGEEVEY